MIESDVNCGDLNNNVVSQLNNILGESFINGEKRVFVKATYLCSPKLNSKILSKTDIENYIYINLNDNENFQITLSVNLSSCFISFAYEIDGYLYPNHSAFYPCDVSFLLENINLKSSKCLNTDALNYREISYDENIIGEWMLDSIYPKDNRNMEFDNSFFRFTKDTLFIGNSRR